MKLICKLDESRKKEHIMENKSLIQKETVFLNEVTELVHKPEDIWKRRRVLIRDIICTRKFSLLFSFHV